MNRRSFLLAAASLPVTSALPAVAMPTAAPYVNPLFRGEIGHFNGIHIRDGIDDVLTLAMIRRAVNVGKRNKMEPIGGNYYFIVPTKHKGIR